MNEVVDTRTEEEKFNDDLFAKAAELSQKYNGAEVVPVHYIDPINPEGTPIVGFLKEPNRMTKANIADEILKSHFRGSAVALEACLLKDVSDPRLWSQRREYDAIVFAAGETAAQFVQIAISQVKKKLKTEELPKIQTS
jgi:hypothetical protein